MEEAAIFRHGLLDKQEGALGSLLPIRTIEHDSSARQRGDHQAVPVGEDLVVEAGTNAAGACGQQLLAQGAQMGFGFDASQRLVIETVGNVVAFEVAGLRDVVGGRENLGILLTEDLANLPKGPDVELAFLPFAVGIERGCESAAFADHLTQQPGDGFVDALGEQRFMRFAPDFGEEVEQQRVIVEHLFEVRHEPALVDGVAREAAADVIIDAALADVAQRVDDGCLRRVVAVADGAAPEQPEETPLRKLRCAVEAAVRDVDRAHHARREIAQQVVVDDDRLAGTLAGVLLTGEGVDENVGVMDHVIMLVAMDRRDAA